MTSAKPGPEERAGDSGNFRGLGILMFILPIIGLAVHVPLLFWAPPEFTRAYFRSGAMAVVCVVAFANLFANYFHYRRTGMRLDIATRILTNLWIVSTLLLLYLAYRSLPMPAEA